MLFLVYNEFLKSYFTAVVEEAEEKPWRGLIPLELSEDRVVPGCSSNERKIQAARESSTLQALYFKGQM